jgi:hypothetical protein
MSTDALLAMITELSAELQAEKAARIAGDEKRIAAIENSVKTLFDSKSKTYRFSVVRGSDGLIKEIVMVPE